MSKLQVSEYKQIQNLLDLSFGVENYTANFPQIFYKNSSFFLSEKIENKIVSFCTLFPYYFFYKSELIKGHCIGSVATLPEFRKQGISTLLLEQAEKKSRAEGGEFIFLFSEQNSFYEKRNYQLCGKNYLAKLNKKSSILKEIPKLKLNKIEIIAFTKSHKLDFNFMVQLWNFIIQNSNPGESLMSFMEFTSILSIKNMELYCCLEQGKIKGVAFFHKGDDFKNVVHGIYFHKSFYILIILNFIIQKIDHDIYFFPGVFYKYFSNLFQFEESPALYIKYLSQNSTKNSQLALNFQKNLLFVRSLQGT